jgi:hypothetical protein
MTDLVRLGRRPHPRINDGSFVEDFEVYIGEKGFKVHVYMTRSQNYAHTINSDIQANWRSNRDLTLDPLDDESVRTLTHIRDNVLVPGKYVCVVSFTDFAGFTAISSSDRSSPSEDGAHLFDVLRLIVAALNEILIEDGEIEKTCLVMMMSDKSDPRRARVYQKMRGRSTDVFKNTFYDTNSDSKLDKIYVY